MGTGTLNLNILKTEAQTDPIIELTDSGANGGVIFSGVTSFNDSATFNSLVKVGGTDITYNFVPAGAVMAFAMLTPPTGWLECDGAEYSESTYANLFDAIGTTYNTGGETAGYFRLPDLRGEFIRGFDNGRGIDADRDSDGALSLAQGSQYGQHQHYVTTNAYVSSNTSGISNVTSSNYVANRTSGATDWAYAYRATNSVADIGLSSASGGTSNSNETRPRNIAMMYCIKY